MLRAMVEAGETGKNQKNRKTQIAGLTWGWENVESAAPTLHLSGALTLQAVENVWQPFTRQLRGFAKDARLTVDAAGVDDCDSSGAAMLLQIRRLALAHGFQAEITGLAEEFQQLLDQFDPNNFRELTPQIHEEHSIFVQTGEATRGIVRDTRNNIAFIGEVTRGIFQSIIHPSSLRWGEIRLIFERAGVDSLPLVGLISVIIGLILAFQSAMPMQRFGADIFVANLVTLAMFRELGGLMTAIILAGRSGSAFAAEIGTMKVNEELDALQTLGIDRIRFLVLPRIIAVVLAMPMLTVFAGFCGVAGGFVVMMAIGHTPAAILTQILAINPLQDFLLGIGKAFVFGLTIAAIGCLRGLETGAGASAVGRSATSAVVSGIFLVIVLDGIFAVIFFNLGW